MSLPLPAPSPSLAQFRDQLRQEGHLATMVTADPVLRLLQQVMVRVLPALGLDPDEPLDRFLQHTPLSLVYLHLLVLRHGLKAKELASSVGLERASLRTYRSHLNAFLKALEQHFRPARVLGDPLLLKDWSPLVEVIQQQSTQSLAAARRIARYGSARQLRPADFTQEILDQYRIWLEQESGLKTWKEDFHHLKKAWGIWVGMSLAQALTFITPQRSPGDFGLRWEDLPAPAAEAFSLYAHLATTDDPDARLERAAIKASTLETNRAAYLDYLGFLHHIHGVDLETTPVPQLFAPALLQAFHDFARQRAQGRTMAWHLRRMRFLRRLADRVISPFLGPVDTGWMDALFAKTTPQIHKKPLPTYSYSLIDQVLNYLEAKIAQDLAQGRSPRQRLPAYTARFSVYLQADHHWRSVNVLEVVLGPQDTAESQTFRLHTKNGQILTETLSPEAHRALIPYLELRQQAGINSNALLVSQNGTPLSYSGLYAMTTRVFMRGTGIHFPPHAYRHLAVGESLQQTSNALYAGAVIGDRSPQVVLSNYRRITPAQVAPAWQGLNRAFRKDRPEALPPPAQTLLRRAQHDPVLRQRIGQAIQQTLEGEKKRGSHSRS